MSCKNLIPKPPKLQMFVEKRYVFFVNKEELTVVKDLIEKKHSLMILSFWTDRPGQTVQTQIRLLLEELSDQGLHCLQFHLHLLEALLYGKASLFKF